MSSFIRLDKFLSNSGVGTRTEVKKYIRKGMVTHQFKIIKDPGYKILTDDLEVSYNGLLVTYERNVYLMLNKPKNVVSATIDNHDKTVIDIIDHPLKLKLFPVGRLDKDTTGLLLLTNDGELSHQLLSPKKHVDKTYEAKVLGQVNEKTIKAFLEGVELEDGYRTMPAKLELINIEEDFSYVKITIQEGKFHQIKRMFESVSMKVFELKRIRMGSLQLDETLKPGEFRELTSKERSSLEMR